MRNPEGAPLLPTLWSKGNFNNKYVQRSDVFGTGAFSTVYHGSNICNSDDVAVKVINRSLLTNEEEERLVAEIEVLRELSHHPNVLSIHDAYCETDSYRIVLEYMNGGDLLTMLEEEKSLTEMKTRNICHSLMSAVAHLHAHSIAHRDIKAENILVSKSGDDFVIKLGDFGFSKKEVTPNCLTTICGTTAYLAPEVLLENHPYGVKCDVWSTGVLAYVLMGGYQPFHAENDDGIKERIVKGEYCFDGKYWSHISDAAKDFITSLLVVGPDDRSSAEEIMTHSWFDVDDTLLSSVSNESAKEKPVFFMIGSQRSGSNWLRTMLDQREDLVGPHPPHILREFMPLISKFGDLSQDENFRILADHVCTFVERNQVPWEDKYGERIIFCRQTICDQGKASCDRLKRQEGNCLNDELYLLSIFDAVMDYFADANGKELWMCKSMGMSAYHTSLLKFYGQRRLRYIYLVRDPRDVALSFMNTPVGDKHYYAIVKKWAKLQKQAMFILDDTPDIIYNIMYEELLENREDVVSGIYDFIGDRRFGGVKRQASVLNIAPVSESVNQAKCGNESFKAHTLSYQFKNLCRGKSFAKEQLAKWKNPESGLKKDDLMMIESLAYDAMEYFGYEAAYVKAPCDVLQFNEDQIAEFAHLNMIGVEQMNENLKKENIADYNRRIHQAEVLSMGAKRLSKRWSLDDDFRASLKKDSILKKLNEGEIVEEYTEKGVLQGFGTFVCGAFSQKGYYPSKPMKENQDSFDVRINDEDGSGVLNHVFGVFDGHGIDGGRCSQLCKATIGDIYKEQLDEGCTTKVSLAKAHVETHNVMVKSATVNAELSGTTTVMASLVGNVLTVAYAGDSAAIIGSKSDRRTPTLLTNPHDLSRPDEVARIERKGGLVMSPEEYDEIKGHMVSNSIHSMSVKDTLHSLPESDDDDGSDDDDDDDDIAKEDGTGVQLRSSLRGSFASGESSLRDSFANSKRRDSRFRRSRRSDLADSKHFHQSISDLMKTLDIEQEESRITSNHEVETPHDYLNQSLRKVISLASTNSFISVASNNNSVPRIWSATSIAKVPGCAFTRSLGDIVAHEIGVSEKPEFKQLSVQDDDVIIIASDGVTEYLDTESIVDIVSAIDDPFEAAKQLVKSASEQWAEKNDYCDDVTAIVIFIRGDNDGVNVSGIEGPINSETEAKKSRPSLFRRFKQKQREKSLKKKGKL